MDWTADWVTAGANIALVVVAIIGFAAAVFTLIQARNRQRTETEGYVRVDIGPPQGTLDYTPTQEIAYIEDGRLEVLGEAADDAPTISVWYRNLQTHPLGVALGVVGRIIFEIVDSAGEVQIIEQEHLVAYLEPRKCVRIDALRFPKDWVVASRIEAVQYRNLDWDGATPRHGRTECYYEDGEFFMIPWSDPINSLRDRAARAVEKTEALVTETWVRLGRRSGRGSE